MKKIEEKDIEDILMYLNSRQSLEAKKILNNLEDCECEKLGKFKGEIERLVRNCGRSSVISLSEIKKIIEENEKIYKKRKRDY